MRNSILLFLLSVFLLTGCRNKENKSNISTDQITDTISTLPSAEQLFIKEIEKTHRSKDFKSHKAITFEVQYKSGKPAKKFSLLTDLTKIKMQLPDDGFIIFDGESFHASTDLPTQSLAEFKNIIQLFGLPFNMQDWTSEAQEKQQDSLQGEIYTTLKLNLKDVKFLEQTTELKVYTAKITGFISALTFLEKESDKNHLVLYKNYFSVGRIPIAKYWEIYQWQNSEATLIDRLSIAQLKFFNPVEDFFNLPSHSVLLD